MKIKFEHTNQSVWPLPVIVTLLQLLSSGGNNGSSLTVARCLVNLANLPPLCDRRILLLLVPGCTSNGVVTDDCSISFLFKLCSNLRRNLGTKKLYLNKNF